jgi:hypothetical protein
LKENNHDDALNAPIFQAEIENVILNLHNDKSSGLHSVSNALLKSIKVQNSFFFVERYKLIMLCKIKILAVVE